MTDLQAEDTRRRMHDVVVGGLSDEGVLSYDQVTAIGRAIMGALDILLTELRDSDTRPKDGDAKQGSTRE